MFSILLVSALLALSEGAPNQEVLNKAISRCSGKFPKDAQKVLMERRVPKTEGEKCFLECIYKDLGIVKDGSLQSKRLKELSKTLLDDKKTVDKAEKVINDCVSKYKPNKEKKCYTAEFIRNCVMDNNAKELLIQRS